MEMDMGIVAKKMSRKMKKSFPLVPLADLESEAYMYLLESTEDNPAGQYVSCNWNLYHYAVGYANSIRECRGEAIMWINDMYNEKETQLFNIEQVLIELELDSAKTLSFDGKYVLDNILSGKLIEELPGSQRYRVSREMIKANLVLIGWSIKRAKEAVNELRFWWRDYGIA